MVVNLTVLVVNQIVLAVNPTVPGFLLGVFNMVATAAETM